MKRFSISLLTAALVLMFSVSAMAAEPCNAAKRKVDSFVYVIDQSGSMMMSMGKTLKINIAKAAVAKVIAATPELGYAGGAYAFAPIAKLADVAPFKKDVLAKAVASVNSNQEAFGRFTPMGQNLADLNPVFNGMPRKAALILVTDGESNMGIDPVEEAKLLYAANPGLVIHIISLADNKVGQATLDAIKALNKESVLYKAADLASSAELADKFAQDVFYDCGSAIVLRSVNFALNSAVINDESAVILNEVAKMIKDGSNKINVDGHTCSLGTEEYNQKLSERRAASVKAYLVKKGVASDRLITRGFGETRPKYDNSTDQGRRMNRRVELTPAK